ncbi:hypothetical protein [Lysinibacillus sp. RS5]|uniref:hypothetical protein n=1 Tax=unclassified Lysinibacillus TaxID=2636778 RepID=UPI0035BE122E
MRSELTADKQEQLSPVEGAVHKGMYAKGSVFFSGKESIVFKRIHIKKDINSMNPII